MCLSSIDWDFLWQTHQQVMAAFAAHDNRVLFVESTGVRTPNLRDLPRLWRRARGGGRGHGSRRPPTNVDVFSPVVPPFPYSSAVQAVSLPILRRAIRRRLREWNVERPIVWSFLPTPLSQSLVRALTPAVSIYHCVDDLAASSVSAARLRDSEAHSFEEADLVFVTSRALWERASRWNPETHLLPSGVDFPRFAGPGETDCDVPDDLRELPHPRVGYLGGLHQWLDQTLLVSLAERRPDWSIVLVGPVQTNVSRLTRVPNVHVLGTRDPDQAPRYLRGFDVGLVPYRVTEYTGSVYPAKLNEYLAVGLAVVSTPLTEIIRFNYDHGDVVAVASDAGGFERAIEEVVAAHGPEASRRRVAVAKTNSWESRIDVMSSLIEDLLRERGFVTSNQD
ncbi:MAG: glycosyltransferase [Acidobacteriota bacterium]|nr:glycosyltransferase [Acidobacteriota bacterium]